MHTEHAPRAVTAHLGETNCLLYPDTDVCLQTFYLCHQCSVMFLITVLILYANM